MNLVEATRAELDRIALQQRGGLRTPRQKIEFLERRMSRAQLAAELGISPGTLTRWRNRKQKPSEKNANVLDRLYQDRRPKKATGRDRAKLKLGTLGVRISGLVQFSDEEPEWRDDYASSMNPKITADQWPDILVAWRAGDDHMLERSMSRALQVATKSGVHFVGDVVLDLG